VTRPIFFLTDFGLADTYVGVVKAVILGIAPDARIVDLTHDVPPQDVRAGAFALLTAVPHLPEDAVVLAVVDPGVGTARRPIAVQVGGRTFVGPDNGLLSWAIGVSEPDGCVVLDRSRFWRPTVSATFHGRDLFGPVAAHLARGVPLAEVGSPCAGIQALPFPPVRRKIDAQWQIVSAQGEIIHVDRFGNLIANLSAADLPSQPIVIIAGRSISGLAPHFQPVGDVATADGSRLIALIGSSGLLEVAVPNGSAAAALVVGVGTPVTVAGRA
jgi:S-adenosyl-L-methionine hydrolase (adenosine-forming)